MSVRSCMDKMIVTRTHKTRGSTESCVRWARGMPPRATPYAGRILFRMRLQYTEIKYIF